MKACPNCGQRFVGKEEFCPIDGETLIEVDSSSGDPLVGTTLDNRYTIKEKLGEGGMGVVYLATHAVIGKRCALKILRGEFTGKSELSERFIQEARSAAAIGNEHIIEVTDFGQILDGSSYFVMEYLDGKSLQDVVDESDGIDVKRTLHIVRQCCQALAAAHSVNIVHRDLKPDNIFLINRRGDPDFTKILDFGVAKVARETGRLTQTGTIIGTPQYMSPEQAAGTELDARTDIYSLGIILYEMLSGRVPFEADSFMGVLTKHLYEMPVSPRELEPPTDIPEDVEAVLLKTIAKRPEKRYQNMVELEQDITAIIENRTPAIVYNQPRNTAQSSMPPPPAEILGIDKPRDPEEKNDVSKEKRWPIFVGLGAVVVVIGAVFLLRGGIEQGGEPRTATKQAQTSAPSKRAQPKKQVQATSIQTAKAESVTLTSQPGGASLYKNGALLGELPFDVPRPVSKDDTVLYRLKLDGHEDMDVGVTAMTPTKVEIPLKQVKEQLPKKSERSGSARNRLKKRGSKLTSPEHKKATKRKAKKRVKKVAGGELLDPWAQ